MLIKQVIVIRKDLNMRKGKMIAQGAHASIRAILSATDQTYDHHGMTIHSTVKEVNEWLNHMQTKICVYVNSEQELLDLYKKVEEETDLPYALIKDAGLTEFKEPTYTALAIGPGKAEDIDPITGSLPLL